MNLIQLKTPSFSSIIFLLEINSKSLLSKSTQIRLFQLVLPIVTISLSSVFVSNVFDILFSISTTAVHHSRVSHFWLISVRMSSTKAGQNKARVHIRTHQRLSFIRMKILLEVSWLIRGRDNQAFSNSNQTYIYKPL